MMATEGALVVADALHRSYGSGHTAVHAVAGISLSVDAGEVVALVGPSGCGKSTLLHLLGGLDQPDAGTVSVAGRDWRDGRGRQRAEWRRRTCGFVFQNLALIPTATAFENVEVPLLLAGVEKSERPRRVSEMLEKVEMLAQSAQLPDQLSGGQQQRIGIARALVHRPALVLADEPTGSLDSATAQVITRLRIETASTHGSAVVMVTHDPRVASQADRTLRLHSGLLQEGPPGLPPAGMIAGEARL
ncbi:MAG: lipoprotein-releasing ABC transporter ATP-binding protein LolD [Actinomycetota bacterium]